MKITRKIFAIVALLLIVAGSASLVAADCPKAPKGYKLVKVVDEVTTEGGTVTVRTICSYKRV